MEKNPVIELRNVAVFHSAKPGSSNPKKRGEMVVSGVNLTVCEGEMVYFIGKVGSGKSSLIKTLYAEVPLVEGEGASWVRPASHEAARHLPPAARHRHRLSGLPAPLGQGRVACALRHRPPGGRTDMRKRIECSVAVWRTRRSDAFRLSGGQQRLAVARALVNNPRVILADEPTGNLDPWAAEDIMEVFRRIVAGGCSIVMSTHNIANIEQFPARTIRFNKGKVEEIDISSVLGA
ncbi:MAG: cell division ATP-binding protein FtsE [Alistipes inops]